MAFPRLKDIGVSLGLAALVGYAAGVAVKTYQLREELAPVAAAFEQAADDYTLARDRQDTLQYDSLDDTWIDNYPRKEREMDEAWGRIENILAQRDGIAERRGCISGGWYVAAGPYDSHSTLTPICLNPFSE